MLTLLSKVLDMGAGSPHWAVRRRWQWIINVFCMGMIVYAASGYMPDKESALKILDNAWLILGATNAWFVSNAVYEDVKVKGAANGQGQQDSAASA